MAILEGMTSSSSELEASKPESESLSVSDVMDESESSRIRLSTTSWQAYALAKSLEASWQSVMRTIVGERGCAKSLRGNLTHLPSLDALERS